MNKNHLTAPRACPSLKVYRNRISEMIKSQDEFIITQDTHEERGNDLKNISTEMIQTETGRGKKK